MTKEKRTIQAERKKQKKNKERKEEQTSNFGGITFVGESANVYFEEEVQKLEPLYVEFEEQKGRTKVNEVMKKNQLDRAITPTKINETVEFIKRVIFENSIVHTFLCWVNYCCLTIGNSLDKIDLSNHKCSNRFECLICAIKHESQFSQNIEENKRKINIGFAHQKANDCKIQNLNRCKACEYVAFMESHNRMRNIDDEIHDSTKGVLNLQNKYLEDLFKLKHLGVQVFHIIQFKKGLKNQNFEPLIHHKIVERKPKDTKMYDLSNTLSTINETKWNIDDITNHYLGEWGWIEEDKSIENHPQYLKAEKHLIEKLKNDTDQLITSETTKEISKIKKIIKTVNPDFEMMTFSQFKKSKF